jgi:hypothetical protein
VCALPVVGRRQGAERSARGRRRGEKCVCAKHYGQGRRAGSGRAAGGVFVQRAGASCDPCALRFSNTCGPCAARRLAGAPWPGCSRSSQVVAAVPVRGPRVRGRDAGAVCRRSHMPRARRQFSRSTPRSRRSCGRSPSPSGWSSPPSRCRCACRILEQEKTLAVEHGRALPAPRCAPVLARAPTPPTCARGCVVPWQARPLTPSGRCTWQH